MPCIYSLPLILLLAMNGRRRINCFLLIVTSLAAFFIFLNLDKPYLWQDEAETALLGKSILLSGVPKAYDGVNLISQEQGLEYNRDYVWFWSPWLQFYLAALSFSIFGVNTFAARLPFALFGVACVVLIYYLGFLISRSERVGKIASLFLVFSVPFLLHVRQCRYYSPLIFFTMLTVLAYLFLKENRKSSPLLFFSSATLLFHSNYVLCLILLFILFLHWSIFDRKEIAMKKIALALGAVLIANSGWLYLFYQQISKRLSHPLRFPFIQTLLTWVKLIDWYIMPLVFFFGATLFFTIKLADNKKKETASSMLLIEIIAGTILFLTFFLPHWVYFRYLLGLIPLFFILTARVIDTLFVRSKVFGFLVFLFLCFVHSNYSFIETRHSAFNLFPILNYFSEISSPNGDATRELVEYLKKDPQLDKKIVATPYGDLPLKFYTSARVIGGLTGEDLSFVKEADYVILREKVYLFLGKAGRDVHDYIAKNVAFKNYRLIQLVYPSYLYENIPEPQYHQFFPLGYSGVRVYVKIK